ncbi:uncharacterized protein MYCGRDRAFT_92956 [Zymoseptoria tritici IPO323]|uniref:Uncharacterized protein n=1 Tax=Zymoseptoria tritici (strain CBS 115943 / IPO323) TaxID=336722 RepID=F9XAK2_ZYMTI|nr:uncharacterized protein MYCGRDRAFT_92956 [Zymoseptoria tritici IPO323]EGP87009.1 hypothetical protein MYCGRDRAFT_92956 [Zymoseptoria tritici IPO323]
MATIHDPQTSASRRQRSKPSTATATTHSALHFHMSFEAGHGPSPLRNEIKEPSNDRAARPTRTTKRTQRSAPQQSSSVNNSDILSQEASPTPSDKVNNALGTTVPQLQTVVKKHAASDRSTSPDPPTFLDFSLSTTSFSLPSNPSDPYTTSPTSSTTPDRTLSHLSPSARALQLSLRQQARREQEQQSLYLESSLRHQLPISDPRHHIPGLDIHQRRHAALVRKAMMSRAEEWEREEEEEGEGRRREEKRSTIEERRAGVLARRAADQVNPTSPPASMRNSLGSLTSSTFRSPRRNSGLKKPSGEPLSEWDLGCGEVEKGEVDETSVWVEQLSRSLADCGVEGGIGGREGSVGEGEGEKKDYGHESDGGESMGMSLEEALAEAMEDVSGAVGGEPGGEAEVVSSKKDDGKEVEEWVEVDEEDLDGEWEEVEGK